MNSNDKGNKGLANVIADLVNKDYFVFLPIADTTEIDLIVSDQKLETKRVQVKYRKIINGKIDIYTSSVVNGKRVPCDLKNTDIWAIYCPDNNNVYYIPSLFLKDKSSLTLRVEESKRKSNKINFAKDFLEINKAWK